MSITKESFRTVYWEDGATIMLDQRVLPHEENYIRYTDVESLAAGIKDMVVRGAPAIGVAAAFGVALAAQSSKGDSSAILAACDLLASTRPTAVNLFWGIERMKRKMEKDGADPAVLISEAIAIHDEDIANCKRMGEFGAELIPDGATILTHCNAGALATAGWGSALGVVRSAVAAGKKVRVIADETRPFLQGARLTAWELQKDGIDVTVACDVAAASLIASGQIDVVVVGTDRIAANGDVANKIGTYGVALAAHAEQIPFYVVGPWSTIDMNCPDGDGIPIEDRPSEEVTHVLGNRILPEGVPVLNPAFDVTPFELVTAIVTEKGVVRPDYKENLKWMSEQ